MKFKTTAAYISGAICGKMWMPHVMAGNLIKKNARGPWGFWTKGDSFRDALHALLLKDGGDFQNAKFTEDTEIVIERKTLNIGGRYNVHIRRLQISKLKDCADLVNKRKTVSDFLRE